MDIIAAYRQVGTYRGAAAMCGTTHKTAKRIIPRAEAGGKAPDRMPRGHNYDLVAELVADRVGVTKGRISAKRPLPAAKAAGYQGSARNFRRLVAEAKRTWRHDNHRGRRPAVWIPGEVLAIDWGSTGSLHVFCAVLAWSRFRFVRFAANERSETTLAMLAGCFEELGGVPKVVLADRMGCLKGGVVANKVVPTAEYVRFATHYGFSELGHFLSVCPVMQLFPDASLSCPVSGGRSKRAAGRAARTTPAGPRCRTSAGPRSARSGGQGTPRRRAAQLACEHAAARARLLPGRERVMRRARRGCSRR